MKRALTVGDLGEEALIRRIARWVDPPPENAVGIGDDAAVLSRPRGAQILTVDVQVEGTHFRRAWTRPEELGWKALAVNVSDAAAMGARPEAALVSLILPADLEVGAVSGLYRGFRRLARREGLVLAGGNLARGDRVSVTIALTGRPLGRRALLRRGARAGDRLFLTGRPGLAALGLHVVKDAVGEGGGDLWRAATAPAARERRDRRLGGGLRRRAAARFLRPEPRVATAAALLPYRPRALIDTSDGLSRDLGHLAGAGCAPVIEADRLPLTRAFRTAVAGLGADAEALALSGGEDYELLFALPPREATRLESSGTLAGKVVSRIGVMESRAKGVYVRREDRTERLPDTTFAHF